MNTSRLTGVALGMTALILLVACDKEPQVQSTPGKGDSVMTEAVETESESVVTEVFTVYKQPTCGCCTEWISHLENEGFDTVARDTEDLNAIKDRHGIEPAHQSCHTAVSSRGYVFEGHIPARYVREFLANPPEDAIGLAVPGMPLGSPGMEVGDRFTPYKVLLLKEDGSSEVFAIIESAAQQ